MTAEKPPIRITKQRAEAFLDVFSRGLEVRIEEMKTKRGVVVHLDGTTSNVNEELTELYEPIGEDELAEEIEALVRAIDTGAIFRRRYG